MRISQLSGRIDYAQEVDTRPFLRSTERSLGSRLMGKDLPISYIIVIILS